MPLTLQLDDRPLWIGVEDLVIAGWTGRDGAAIEAHIRELSELGVQPPKTTPMFYRVAKSLLTTASAIEVIGSDSTGEAEFVLFGADEGRLVGLGSDHTDRKAEVHGITLAKQMCAKVVAPNVWRFTEVEPHWDSLILRAHVISAGRRSLYQEASVAVMLHPTDLAMHYGNFGRGTVMFCGTLPVWGELHWADRFEMELFDPVLKRRIHHSYEIKALPVEE